MLLHAIPDRAYAVAVADRLLEVLGRPVEAAGQAIDVAVSIGIAFDAPTTKTVDELLSEADVAMYRAKALGKGRSHVYQPSDGPQGTFNETTHRIGGNVRRPTAPHPI